MRIEVGQVWKYRDDCKTEYEGQKFIVFNCIWRDQWTVKFLTPWYDSWTRTLIHEHSLSSKWIYEYAELLG